MVVCVMQHDSHDTLNITQDLKGWKLTHNTTPKLYMSTCITTGPHDVKKQDIQFVSCTNLTLHQENAGILQAHLTLK